MKKNDRQLQIMSLLGNAPAMSIHTLATHLNVSEMTVRRDLSELLAKDYITLIQGVAVLNRNDDGTSIAKDYSLGSERHVMEAAKKRIGRLAATLVEDKDTILVDTGTTTEQLLAFLPNGMPLTIMGYNLNTLMAIMDREHTDIYFGGGFFHRNTQMFESEETTSLISRICVNKFFISAAGISTKGTISCIEQHELPAKQNGIRTAIVRILMVDSSKFGKIRPCMFARLNDIDIIVTDTGIEKSWLDLFQSYGIKCMLA